MMERTVTSSELLTRLARAKYLQATHQLSTAAALTAVWNNPQIPPSPIKTEATPALPLEPLEPLLDRLVAQFSPR